MPYVTLAERAEATTKTWFSRLLRHLARKCSGSVLGHNTHTHIYLLNTYVPRTNTGPKKCEQSVSSYNRTCNNNNQLSTSKVHIVNEMNPRCWQMSNDSGEVSKSITALRQFSGQIQKLLKVYVRGSPLHMSAATQ